MALDNAEFIAELSISDPPGTDPLNQGDDHIRTIKKAVQQSFPNVASAVPQTGVQMAQMAIKNEANLFTGINTFQNITDLDAQGSNNQIRFLASGVQSWQIRHETVANDLILARRYIAGVFQDNPITVANATGFATFAKLAFFNGGMLTVDGSAGAVPYSFTSSQASGMYLEASAVSLSFAGTRVARFATSGLSLPAPIFGVDGNVGTPAYTFGLETGTGMFRGAAGSLWFGTNGRTRLKLSDTGRNSFLQGSATLGLSLSLESNTSIIAYSIDYEGTSGFQPGQLSFSRFNRTTGVFIDIPLYINATTGRVHSKLPILTP